MDYEKGWKLLKERVEGNIRTVNECVTWPANEFSESEKAFMRFKLEGYNQFLEMISDIEKQMVED